MRYTILSILLFVIIISPLTAISQFTYISPVPGSSFHNKETSIILRTGDSIDATSLYEDIISISGSISGAHRKSIKLTRDKKTILVKPFPEFSSGETVAVIIHSGFRNASGKGVEELAFQFHVRPDKPVEGLISQESMQYGNEASAMRGANTENQQNKEQHTRELLCENLPPFEIVSTPGAYYDAPVFYRNHASPPDNTCFTATIISSNGDSVFSQYDDNLGFDFKINDNGYLTYWNKTDSCFDMLDSSYNLVKKFYMANGYNSDEHDFRIFPNGYYLLMCDDRETVDMSSYGGYNQANVAGLVLQEFDPDDNLIFEWRSWDHFQFTDAADDVILTNYFVDYVHGNSLELDYDGNLLLSSRNLDEITKIDLNTGDIIWRMGGKNNEFTFIDDPGSPKPFSHQHHFRRLSNGHYTMYDNANYQSDPSSVAKEFVLDQVNKTATLVWSYSHPLVNNYAVAGSALGSVQVLTNGNRFIDWGQLTNITFADIPNFTEVDSLGNIVWEFRFIDSFYVSYRAHKFLWDRCHLIPDSTLLAYDITENSATLQWGDNVKFSGFKLEFKKCTDSSWISVSIDTNYVLITGLPMNTCYDWRILSLCDIYNDSSYTGTHQFTTLNAVSANMSSTVWNSPDLFPNPATEETEIRFMMTHVGSSQIIITDLSGHVIDKMVAQAEAGINKLRLDLSYFNPGIYLVCMNIEGRNFITKLVVI